MDRGKQPQQHRPGAANPAQAVLGAGKSLQSAADGPYSSRLPADQHQMETRRCRDAGTQACGDTGGGSPGRSRLPDREKGEIKHSPAKFAEESRPAPQPKFPFLLAPSLRVSSLLTPPFTSVWGSGGGEMPKGTTSKPEPKTLGLHSGCNHTPGPRPHEPLPLASSNMINGHFPKIKSEFVKSCVTVNLLTFFCCGDSTVLRSFNPDMGHLSGKCLPWKSTYTLLNSLHLLQAPQVGGPGPWGTPMMQS